MLQHRDMPRGKLTNRSFGQTTLNLPQVLAAILLFLNGTGLQYQIQPMEKGGTISEKKQNNFFFILGNYLNAYSINYSIVYSIIVSNAYRSTLRLFFLSILYSS